MGLQEDGEVAEWVEEIRQLVTKITQKIDPEESAILTDGVIVSARRWWTKDGKSCSQVQVFPLNDVQPDYVTTGLLSIAMDMEDDRMSYSDVEEDGDDVTP